MTRSVHRFRFWFREFGENSWSANTYAWFRTGLGAYLALHFALLVPWAAELFSNAGALPDGSASPLLGLFPNVLAVADGATAVTLLVGTGAALGLAIAAGFGDRIAAVGCWYLLACLLGRNPLIANPSLPYVGWLLLAHALFAPSVAARASGRWWMPPALFATAWLVMAGGYTYSGLTKLASPSWLDGSAVAHVLANPLARPGPLREMLLELPTGAIHLATWSVLSLELAFLPLALSRRLRPFVWLAMTGMHLGLLVLVDFADLTAGMLLLHAFTLDPGWLRRAWRALEPSIHELGRTRGLGWGLFRV